MRSIGLVNAHRHYYDYAKVTSMIDNNKPLIICAMPGINVFVSHCWNIDGYRISERTITSDVYKEGGLVSSTQRKETRDMIHLDFGWDGWCNGYYVSGVFRLNDANNIEFDKQEDKGRDRNFNTLLRIITY